jgi:hypothetical protein
MVADQMLVPGFFGQDPHHSQVVLSDLADGTHFDTTALRAKPWNGRASVFPSPHGNTPQPGEDAGVSDKSANPGRSAAVVAAAVTTVVA